MFADFSGGCMICWYVLCQVWLWPQLWDGQSSSQVYLGSACGWWEGLMIYRSSSDCLPYWRCLAGRDHDMGGALFLRFTLSRLPVCCLQCVDVFFCVAACFTMFLLLAKTMGLVAFGLWEWLTMFDIVHNDGFLQCAVWHRHREGCTIYAWSCTIAWSTTWRWNVLHRRCAMVLCHALTNRTMKRKRMCYVEVLARTDFCILLRSQEKFYARVFGETPFARPEMIQVPFLQWHFSHLFTKFQKPWPSFISTPPRGIWLRGAQRWLGVEWGLDLCTGILFQSSSSLAAWNSTFALELCAMFRWLGSIKPGFLGTWRTIGCYSVSPLFCVIVILMIVSQDIPRHFPHQKSQLPPVC